LTASGTQGGRLWDLEGKVLAEYPMPARSLVQKCAFSPDGQTVGFGGLDGISWLFEADGILITTLLGHDDRVLDLRFSPDGRWVATASKDGTARLWSVRDETLPMYRGHHGPVFAAISPDGSRVATASWDRTARIWSSDGRDFVPLRGHQDNIFTIAFDADGTRVVTASADGTACIWDLDGRPLHVLPHDPDAVIVRTAGFSPDGNQVATGCIDGSVWIWSADGVRLDRFPAIGGMPWHVEFAADGKRLLIARLNGPVLILELADRSVRSLGYRGYHATFTPDGHVLIACVDGRVVRLNEQGEPVDEFAAHEAAMNWVEMSPNGERIVTASNDGTARIWRVNGTLEMTLRGHKGDVEVARFSPDGDRVLTADDDGTAKTWMADAVELVRLADERVVRDFSGSELVRYEELLDVPVAEARRVVDRLKEELLHREKILARLREDDDLDADVRETALRLAKDIVDSPESWNENAWTVAWEPGRDSVEYERAHRFASAACEVQPGDPRLLLTLGMAQYRMGRWETALETLDRCEARDSLAVRAYVLVFRAMAQQRLGRIAEAKSDLADCRELLGRMDEKVVEGGYSDLLREADALIEGDGDTGR